MDLSDHETLLAPLSEDEPCGPDLEYDADFGEMERAAQSSGEQQFGSTIVAAEPADWKDVKKRAGELLSRTKDMRVVAYLSRAVLHQDGIVEFELAIRLLRAYLETFWETVHPELDHEDNDDPTYRTNTLITFCDEQGMLRDLRETPIVQSRAVGKFSLRDVELAAEAAEQSGHDAGEEDAEADDSEKSVPTMAVIEAAFSDSAIDDIKATEEAIRLAAEHFKTIEQFVTEKVGVNFAVSLSPVRTTLEQMDKVVVAQLERLGAYDEEPEPEEDSSWGDAGWGESEAPAESAAGGPAAAAAPPQGYRLNGKITSRQEAIKALDDVCDFYEENEPSSPLPLLIRRAQRLASKSFLDILRDLAPDAVSQAEALGGNDVDEYSSSSYSSPPSSSYESDTSEQASDDSSTW